jgi:hypothetical protein
MMIVPPAPDAEDITYFVWRGLFDNTPFMREGLTLTSSRWCSTSTWTYVSKILDFNLKMMMFNFNLMLTFEKLEHDFMFMFMFISKKFSSYSEVSAPQHAHGGFGIAHTDARMWWCILFFQLIKIFFNMFMLLHWSLIADQWNNFMLLLTSCCCWLHVVVDFMLLFDVFFLVVVYRWVGLNLNDKN